VHVDGGSLQVCVTVVVPHTPAPAHVAGCVVSTPAAQLVAPDLHAVSVDEPGLAHAVPPALHAGV
jgi:hypothetical protein